MKDNLLALLAQLDCGNRSAISQTTKVGNALMAGATALKNCPLKLRAALVKFWRDEICTFDCEGGVTTSTREVINLEAQSAPINTKKAISIFRGRS